MAQAARDPSARRSPWATPPSASGMRPAARIAAPAPRGDLVPRVAVQPSREDAWTWVSTHGGAGSTSLTHGSGRGLHLTGCWPAPPLGWPAPLVLVARSNMAGLAAAGRFVQEWAARMTPDLLLAGLVIVADAPGRPTRAARNRSSELESVTAVWHMPWIGRWRDTPYTPDPSAEKVAAAVAAALVKENRS